MVGFRKSKKFGPVRITASKSGLSTSVGVKGLRVSANSKGQVRRTVSVPGTGIYDTKQIGSTRSRTSARAASGSAPAVSTLSFDYVDATGGTRQLLDGDETVASHKVVGIPGGSGAIAGLAAWAGVRPNEQGWARGIRDGLVIDRGSQVDVVLMATPADNPSAFTKKERKAGTPKGRPVGRLGKRDETKWRSYRTTSDSVRVGIYVDATPGLDPVLEVRLRPSLLRTDLLAANTAAAKPDDPGPTATPTASSPPGWHPDPHGRHALRYWDGAAWTPHVSTNGVQSTDPV